MEVSFAKSRYHDCLETEFQQSVGSKQRNASVVWQLQAMTGNDKQASQHGTNHGISAQRQEKDYANQVIGLRVNYRVGVNG